MKDTSIPDKESKEILEEMKKDGVLPEEETPEELKDPKPPVDDKDLKDKNKKPPVDEPGKPKEPDAEEEEEEDDDGKGEKDNEEEPVNRPRKYIPLKKLKKIKESHEKEVTDLKARIAELEKGSKPAVDAPNAEDKPENLADDPKIKELAEKHNVEPELLIGLVDILQSKVKPKEVIKPELAKDLEALIEKSKQAEISKKHQELFEKEFAGLVKDYPDEDIASHKDELKQLAFGKYNKESLFEIFFRRYKPENGSRKGSEQLKPGAKKPIDEKPDFDTMSEDDAIKTLSDEEFDKYCEYKASKSKAKISRA